MLPMIPRSKPEAQGLASEALLQFLDELKKHKLELHSLMLLRHGHVIAEAWWSPYSADRPHLLYSLSKSFTASAIGLAINEGLLSLNDRVLSFFPEKAPAEPSANLTQMTVQHLLCMSTGHEVDTLERILQHEPHDWVKGFLSLPPEQAPGTLFCYNNGASFMLSAILQKCSGQKLLDYLEPRLFAPLGISTKYWLEAPGGSNQGFSGLHLCTKDIAHFGQLYLQKGKWQGVQLIPESWTKHASSFQIANAGSSEPEALDWAQGYGYQFWRGQHRSYRGDGAFGQFCLILPEQDAVLAITSAVKTMQDVLNLVWHYLLPAMSESSLAINQEAQARLSARLANLSIDPIKGARSSELAGQISQQRYKLNNTQVKQRMDDLPYVDTVSFDFATNDWQIVLASNEASYSIRGAYDSWQEGSSTYFSHASTNPVAVLVCGAWISEASFQLAIRYIETPHMLSMTCTFSHDGLRLERRWNVSFEDPALADVYGSKL